MTKRTCVFGMLAALVAATACVRLMISCKENDREGSSEGECSVVLYSPPSPDASVVTISWDGRVLFRGKLPHNTSGLTGHPVKLTKCGGRSKSAARGGTE